MIEQRRQELLEKIQNKNLKFDKEDLCVLEIYPEYFKLVIEVLAQGVDYWNNEIFSMITDEYLLSVPQEICDAFWLNYAKYMVKSDEELDEEVVNNIFSLVKLQEETKKQILRLLDEQQDNKLNSNKESSSITQEKLRELYENKRYDQIAKINTQLYNFPLDLIKNIIDDFPYEQYESPTFFAYYPEFIKEILDKLSIKCLVEILDINRYGYSGNQSKLSSYEITSELLKKLKVLKFDEPTFIQLDLSRLDSQLYLIKKDLATLAIDNNILNFLSYTFYHAYGTAEQREQQLIEYIKKTDNIDTLIAEWITPDKVKNNIQILDALIEKGFLYTIIEKNLLDVAPDKEQIIIELLRKNAPQYSEIGKSLYLSNELVNHPNILNAIIDNYQIEVIHLCRKEQHGYSDKYNEKNIEKISEIIHRNNDVIIKDIAQFKTENSYSQLIKVLFECKNYDCILSILFSINYYNLSEMQNRVIEENKECLKRIIDESLSFTNELIKKYSTLVTKNKTLLEIIAHNDYAATQIISHVNHHEELKYFYTHENFLLLIDYFEKKYNIRKDRLLRFEDTFGPMIIRYIENENVQAVFEFDDTTFERFINLFPKLEFTMQDLESSYDSLKQYEFSKKHADEIAIFPNILHSLEDNDEEKLQNFLNRIPKYLDKNFFNRLKKEYTLPEEYNENNPKLFLLFVIEKIKHSDGDKREKYINILHQITDYYILKKREEYRTTYDMIRELKLPYNLNPRSLESELLKYYIENSHSYYVDHTIDSNGETKKENISLNNYMKRKMKNYKLSEDLIDETLNFYINGIAWYEDKASGKYPENELKKNFKYIMKTIREIVEEEPRHNLFTTYSQSATNYLESEGKIKKDYIPGESGIELFDIITSLKVEVLEQCVLSNDEVYESLKNQMIKRKLHLLPKSLKMILNSRDINVSDDFSNIGSFISYYAQIYEKEKRNLASNNKPTDNITINLINILINAEVYSSISSIYAQVLGDEDSKLIKANPGPNSASIKLANNARLIEAVELTKKNFERKVVTVPTFNEDFTIDNNKKIRVIVGNFTHPSNLTHGERTGACMRIGGVGESLFYFCLKNPNGFHIRFENPENGNYISRVSGFRNGNTVFLNELRYSCDQEKYSDKDVVEGCKKAAEHLIELSKNSPYPIENVVIHRAYATSSMSDENITLDKNNIKEGLTPFYSDVSNNVIILATTSKTSKFVPLNFDKKNIPKYLPAREKIISSTDIQIVSAKITRIDTIKRMLAGENYEYISALEFKNGLTYAIVSEDWYICIDENGLIHSDAIDLDPRAKEELAEYMIKLETELNQGNIKKESTYGI